MRNLAGHLGCITYNADDGKVYGSLELKHDVIGQGIINRTGWNPTDEDSFYLAAFDCDKINRADMNAESDSVMSTVYLRDVVNDYNSTEESGLYKHRYGCSGIDGTGYGPVFGHGKDSPKKLMVAYGIYGEENRVGNDYQVILQYGADTVQRYGRPLIQSAPHHSGPEKAEERYFFRTGNTVFGIQNLEYDAYTEDWIVAVYRGHKECFDNFPMFFIDGRKAPEYTMLDGRNGEEGQVLSCADIGIKGKNGIYGSGFGYGQTGVFSVGDGTYYFSHPGENKDEKKFCSEVVKYRFDKDNINLFTEYIT